MRVDREKRRRVFYAEHDAILIEQYANATLDMIAAWSEAWDVSRDAIRNRALVLGVRRSEVARANAQAQAQHDRNGSVVAWEPPAPDRDEEYVAACIAQGGFPVVVWINGEPRTVYRSEWAQ
jgi:hypothetical protein